MPSSRQVKMHLTSTCTSHTAPPGARWEAQSPDLHGKLNPKYETSSSWLTFLVPDFAADAIKLWGPRQLRKASEVIKWFGPRSTPRKCEFRNGECEECRRWTGRRFECCVLDGVLGSPGSMQSIFGNATTMAEWRYPTLWLPHKKQMPKNA